MDSVFPSKEYSKNQKFLSFINGDKIIHEFTTSKLDYCKSFFLATQYPLSGPYNWLKIPLFVYLLEQRGGNTLHKSYLAFLHWLPIRIRIELKILFFTYKALYCQASFYIKKLLERDHPRKSLRSEDAGLLVNRKVSKIR